MSQPDLQRLFRAARKAPEPDLEMPFGFDTRVVALARAQVPGHSPLVPELSRLLRRVAVFSLVLTVFASSAAYWQLRDNETAAESFTNAYAIADTALAEEFSE